MEIVCSCHGVSDTATKLFLCREYETIAAGVLNSEDINIDLDTQWQFHLKVLTQPLMAQGNGTS